MRKPNTFIVGAPKCGTTAMAAYLADHPNVFMSSPKEPHHFVYEDMPNKSNFSSLTKYLEIFAGANENHSIIAEASVWYLYSSDAIKKIAAFDPNAKIIAMLRRPDEMVYSMHSQAVVTFQEDIKDFTKAWEVSSGKDKRCSYAKTCKEPRLLQYDQIAKYGEQLTNVQNYFPDDQVHVVFYDDFKSSTISEYSRVLDFLGLPATGRTHFPKVNPNTELRFKSLGAILKNPPAILMSVFSKVKGMLGIKKVGLRTRLTQVNQKKIMRRKLENETRQEIIDNYKEDIKLLASITNRDLAHWLI